MRPSTHHYGRFDATARLLMAERLRGSSDVDALSEVVGRLCDARQAMGHHFHDLNRVWSWAELGVLLVEARNRGRLLAMGRSAPKVKGPRLDPNRLPADRLEVQSRPTATWPWWRRCGRSGPDGRGWRGGRGGEGAAEHV